MWHAESLEMKAEAVSVILLRFPTVGFFVGAGGLVRFFFQCSIVVSRA